MTKKELKNLYYLKKEINEQQKRLEELEMLATKCSNEISEIPHGNRILDKVGNYAVEIADLKKLIEKNLEKRIEEYRKLTAFIENIEDSQLRLILILRYVYNLTWQKIAFKIGEHDEQYPRRKHNTFLNGKEFKKVNSII